MNTFENVINCAATVFGDAGEFVDDGVYTVDFDGVKLALFTSNDDSEDVYFRAKVASIEGTDDPGKLCEEVLQGNFFWSGTGGAILSLNREERAIYLTDRISADDLPDADAVLSACRDLLRIVRDWQLRRDAHLVNSENEEAL